MPTVVNAQPLVDAIEAAVTAQGVAIGNGEKPTVAAGKPWVVHWMDAGTVDDRSMRSRDGFLLTAPFQVYGFDPDSIRIAVRKVRAAILGLHGMTVDGRTVQRPVHEPSPLMSRDDDADPEQWMQYEEWRIRTT